MPPNDRGNTRQKIVHLIVAARPNFMKIAPLYHQLRSSEEFRPVLIHTGQHFSNAMSDQFLSDLLLPKPDVHLGINTGTHAQQTAGVMIAYEAVCERERPSWVVVPGDVNSTLACALTAKKLQLGVIHLEAGLRSFDHSMPEEINRIVTDAISDVFWTPSPDADNNLRSEGVADSAIMRIGNIMIDSFEMMRPRIEAVAAKSPPTETEFAVVTLHRPSNVDDPKSLTKLVSTLLKVSEQLPLIFPLHPRTEGKLVEFDLLNRLRHAGSVELLSPIGYIEFMARVCRARMVITDSGGVQEETTYLGIPCLTLRPNTERPMTVTHGTNQLVDASTLEETVMHTLNSATVQNPPIEFWDGHAAIRAVENLTQISEC